MALNVNHTSTLQIAPGCQTASLSLTGTPIPSSLFLLAVGLLFLMLVIIALVASRKKVKKAGDALANEIERSPGKGGIDMKRDNRHRPRH